MNASKSSGLGFSGALTLLFIALKLMGHIDWSWWWVLSPLWLPLAVFAAASITVMGLMIGFTFLSYRYARWRSRRW